MKFKEFQGRLAAEFHAQNSLEFLEASNHGLGAAQREQAAKYHGRHILTFRSHGQQSFTVGYGFLVLSSLAFQTGQRR